MPVVVRPPLMRASAMPVMRAPSCLSGSQQLTPLSRHHQQQLTPLSPHHQQLTPLSLLCILTQSLPLSPYSSRHCRHCRSNAQQQLQQSPCCQTMLPIMLAPLSLHHLPVAHATANIPQRKIPSTGQSDPVQGRLISFSCSSQAHFKQSLMHSPSPPHNFQL